MVDYGVSHQNMGFIRLILVSQLVNKGSKNKQKGEVPIPSELAAALKTYVAGLEPDDVVFPFPSTSGSIVDMLRRDLDGAGIPWQLPSGEVIDFHAFRSTAITWWLDVDGLKPKRVQVLSRLKSISMLNNYSRNLRIEEHGWLDQSPRLVQLEVAVDASAAVSDVPTSP